MYERRRFYHAQLRISVMVLHKVIMGLIDSSKFHRRKTQSILIGAQNTTIIHTIAADTMRHS